MRAKERLSWAGKLFRNNSIILALLAAMGLSLLLAAGCRTRILPRKEDRKQKEEAKKKAEKKKRE